MRLVRHVATCCVLIAIACLLARPVDASTLDVAPGYDLFETDSTQTVYDGLGNLMGVPIGDYNFGGAIGLQNLGSTDTMLQRLATATPGDPTVNVAVAAMQLETVAPVNFGGFGVDNYFVTQSLTNLSSGTMTVSWDGTGLAGTFSSTLDVFYDIHKGALNGPIVYSGDALLSNASTAWSDVAPGNSTTIAGVNQFLSGTPGDPTKDFWPAAGMSQSVIGFQQVLNPTPLPEPATVLPFGLGTIGVLAIAAKRRRGV